MISVTTALLLAAGCCITGFAAGWLALKGKLGTALAGLEGERELHRRTTADCAEARAVREQYIGRLSAAERAAAQWQRGYEEKCSALDSCKGEHSAALAILRSERDTAQCAKEETGTQLTALREREHSLTQRIAAQDAFIKTSEQGLKDAFGALSAQALHQNNEQFVALAQAKLEERTTEAQGTLEGKEQAIRQLVQPLAESLKGMDEKINALEQSRQRAYGDVYRLMEEMQKTTLALGEGTRSLVGALKTSHTRGRWGEIALRRLVEFAGMTAHCDFCEQVSTEGESGKLRPDMTISMPEGRRLPVDSKVPFDAYYALHETDDGAAQKACLARHVAAVRKHIDDLGGKAYWNQFADAPDFVILYMHIESSFGAALQADPQLIEDALAKRIIIATPTTLITVLRSVAYSWQQRSTMENIDAIREAAVEMYERSSVLMKHLKGMGTSLRGTITAYNNVVGSLEGNFLPQGRRIAAMAGGYVKTATLPEAESIEIVPREIVAATPEPASGNALVA